MAMPSHRYTATNTMHEEHKHLGSVFMRLPFELRIDIYERIFNASLDNSLLPDPLDPRTMRRAMLRTLHINRAIRNESHDICTKLVKRHIKAPGARIMGDNTTRYEITRICIFSPPATNSPHFQPYRGLVERLASPIEMISCDANKVIALCGFLRALKTPHGGKLGVPLLYTLRVCSRLHLLYHDAIQRLGGTGDGGLETLRNSYGLLQSDQYTIN
jgi:hypothetical protein